MVSKTSSRPVERPCTESIDRLYLELSQFTQALTAREYAYQSALMEIVQTVRFNKFPEKCHSEATQLRYLHDIAIGALSKHSDLT